MSTRRSLHSHAPVFGRADGCSSPPLRTAGTGVCGSPEGVLSWGAVGAPDAAASCCGAGMPRSACCSKVCMKSLWVDSVRAVNRLVTDSVTCQQHKTCLGPCKRLQTRILECALSMDAAQCMSDKLIFTLNQYHTMIQVIHSVHEGHQDRCPTHICRCGLSETTGGTSSRASWARKAVDSA